MELNTATKEKIDALALWLEKPAQQVLDEALDSYLKQQQNEQLEEDLAKHKKETDLSYDEFWGDVDFEE